jgi:DNA-binding SARP family transcriptional activator
VTLLLERGIEYFQQERYAEGMALLTLAGEYLTPDQEHLADLLEMVRREYFAYSRLQQTLQEVSAQFIEAHAELKVSMAVLSALWSMLLAETNSGPTLHISGYVHRSMEQAPIEGDVANPTLYAVCFSPFELRCLGVPIALCSNHNGQAVLRYLIAQPDHGATADTLMALLWPEDPVEVALRKLHVTVSLLRRSLQVGYDLQVNYILYKHGIYQLNPSIPLHSDVEEFLGLYNAGRKMGGDVATCHYEKACSLYIRPFLMEDLYADWSFSHREQLRQIYLDMCSALISHYLEKHAFETAVLWATVVIRENPCDEATYRQLMRIYALQGKRHDALRQYQRCQQVLRDELNLQPMPETVALYQAIIRGELNQ